MNKPMHKPTPLRALWCAAALSVAVAAPVHAQIDRSAPPTLGAPPALKLPPVTVRQLSNGLKLMIVERHQLPMADFVLVIPAGAALNPPTKAGLADLASEMLTEGTASRTSLQIDDQQAFLGVELQASSGWDATSVSLTTPTAQLDSALALMSDVVLHSTFPADEFDRRKQERLTDLIQLKDRGPAIADRAYIATVFGREHPYGRPALGTEASVGNITVNDVKAFYAAHVIPAGATMIIVGDVNPDQIEKKVATLFGDWHGDTTTATTAAEPPRTTAPTTIYLIDKPGAAQSSFRIGSVGVARSTPDYFPLEVVNTALGGSFTSRLNQNLRETKGYTYGAGSRFDMRKTAGPFTARAEIVAAKTDSALIEFMKELRAIRDTIPTGELSKTKNYIQLQLPGEFESNSDIAQKLTSVALYGLPLDYYNGYVAHVSAVTQSDAQRIAQQYIDPAHLVIVIVGDRKTIEPGLRALNIARIVIRDLEGNAIQ